MPVACLLITGFKGDPTPSTPHLPQCGVGKQDAARTGGGGSDLGAGHGQSRARAGGRLGSRGRILRHPEGVGRSGGEELGVHGGVGDYEGKEAGTLKW